MTVESKLATQVLQKALENSQTETKPLQQDGPSSFQQLLDNTQEAFDFAQKVGIETQVGGKAQAVSAESIPFDMSMDASKRFAPSGGDKILNMMADFNQQQNRMDVMINEILYGGKQFSKEELLAIQAEVFRLAQFTELTVKSVELTVSSFKGVMNTQIQ